MVQTIWRGTIAFGLVSIPVRLYAATEQHDISFRQVHDKDGGRIRYRRFCEVDDQEVPFADIIRGYELPDGRVVPISADDLKQLPLPTSRQVEVLEFVPIDQVNPILFARAYYLSPDGHRPKSYVLLREALEQSGRCAVVKVAIRTRETLALLRVSDGVLVMQTMLWPDEIRDASFARPDTSIEVKTREAAMAKTYIRALQTDFDPDRYHDDFKEALEQLVEAKIHGYAGTDTGGQRTDRKVTDLLGALKASVEEARKKRAPSTRKAPAKATAPTAAKKTATPRKKPATGAAKKTTAKKAVTRRPSRKQSRPGAEPRIR
jgi:DNA end-binding protein Ku